MPAQSQQNAMKMIASHHKEAIPQFTFSVFLICLGALPLALSRTYASGWQLLYTIEILCFFIVVYAFVKRRTLDTAKQVWILLILDLIVSVSSIMTFGIAGSGVASGISCILICMYFINARAAIVISSVLAIAFFSSMYLFVFTDKELPMDGTSYISSFGFWATTLFGSCFFIMLSIFGMFKQRKVSFDLIQELQERNETIEKQKKALEHLANHDSLTGLTSLRMAKQKLQAAINKAESADHQSALFFLDLDGFKATNDNHGHSVGDLVLKETAVRIKSIIRENDTACRIGGDEFIILIEKVDDTRHIEDLSQRLIEIINKPIIAEENLVTVGVSIGVVTYPTVEKDAKSLLKKADKLMYEVKACGKNSYLLAT